VVPQVQASGRRYRLVLNFPNPVCKKSLPGRNFHPPGVFLPEGTRISERRRLCDAKTN
jgi:hypothetical protein